MQVTSNMIQEDHEPQYRPELELITTFCCTHTQSITVPLQGFLNAIVYGWTREDFLYVMAGGVITEAEQLNDETARVEVEDSGILSSIENSERSPTSSTR